MRIRTVAIAAAFALLPAAALAHHTTAHTGHGSHGAAAENAAVKAYREANERMHHDMDIRFSGDADGDFLKGMIPHHQGAVDMAKVVLQHGKDPQIRRLAEDIIRGQEKEIAEMRALLAAKGQ
jgi:uncharacterized protein (DUF305 family)